MLKISVYSLTEKFRKWEYDGIGGNWDTNSSFLLILFTKFLDYLVPHKEGKPGVETEDTLQRVSKKSHLTAQILQMMKCLLSPKFRS